MSFNKCIVYGNLGRDTELKFTPQGTALCTFSVATTEKRKDKNGESQDITTWFSCVAFAKTGELIHEYFKKGSPIYLEGRLSLDEWTDRDGGKRSTLKLTVTAFEFMGKAGEQSESKPAAKSAAFEVQRPARTTTQPPYAEDNGPPF